MFAGGGGLLFFSCASVSLTTFSTLFWIQTLGSSVRDCTYF